MEKYVLIFEDGYVAMDETDQISEADFSAADNGYLDIIRVSDMSRYAGGTSWEPLEKVIKE